MICFGWKESAIYSPRYAHFRKWLTNGQFVFIAVHNGQSRPFIAPEAPIPHHPFKEDISKDKSLGRFVCNELEEEKARRSS